MRCLRDLFEENAFTHVRTTTGEVTQSIVPRLPIRAGEMKGDRTSLKYSSSASLVSLPLIRLYTRSLASILVSSA